MITVFVYRTTGDVSIFARTVETELSHGEFFHACKASIIFPAGTKVEFSLLGPSHEVCVFQTTGEYEYDADKDFLVTPLMLIGDDSNMSPKSFCNFLKYLWVDWANFVEILKK